MYAASTQPPRSMRKPAKKRPGSLVAARPLPILRTHLFKNALSNYHVKIYILFKSIAVVIVNHL